jgi:hypothetical protein
MTMLSGMVNAAELTTPASYPKSDVPYWFASTQQINTDAFVSRGFSAAGFTSASASWHVRLNAPGYLESVSQFFAGVSSSSLRPVPFASCTGNCASAQQIQGWLGFGSDLARVYASAGIGQATDSLAVGMPAGISDRAFVGGRISVKLSSQWMVSLQYERSENIGCSRSCYNNFASITPVSDSSILLRFDLLTAINFKGDDEEKDWVGPLRFRK